jgi:ankyrin repeat protein
MEDHLEMVKELLKFLVDADVKDDQGSTPLDLAVMYRYHDIADLLRKAQ